MHNADTDNAIMHYARADRQAGAERNLFSGDSLLLWGRRPRPRPLPRASASRLQPPFPSACDLSLLASAAAPRLLAGAALPPGAGFPLSPSGTRPDLASSTAPALPGAPL